MFKRDNEQPLGSELTRDYQKTYVDGKWHEKRYNFLTSLFQNRHIGNPVIEIYYAKDGIIQKTKVINKKANKIFIDGYLLDNTRIFNPRLPVNKNTFDVNLICGFGGICTLKGVVKYTRDNNFENGDSVKYILIGNLYEKNLSLKKDNEELFLFTGEQLFNTNLNEWEVGKGNIVFSFKAPFSEESVEGNITLQMYCLNCK
jgi:hypothetical protein